MTSIAEQIRNLSRPEPTNFDPEEDDFDATRAKIVSKDDGDELDYGKLYSSSLRKRNIALLADEDAKYHGRPASRIDVARMRGDFQESDVSEEEEDDDDEELEDLESEDDDRTKKEVNNEDYVNSDDNDAAVDDNSENYVDNSDDDDDDDYDDDNDDDDNDDDGQTFHGDNDEKDGKGVNSFSTKMEDEVEKGNAVKQQLNLWDSLLEYRIRLQKAMMLVNKLPQSDNYHEFMSSNDNNLKAAKEKERKSLTDLLYKLLIVQEKLLEGNPETRDVLYPGKKNKREEKDEDDEEIPSDSEKEEEEESDEMEMETNNTASLKLPLKRKRDLTQEEFSECITKRHAAFQSYRDSVISKWSEKTRLASGKLSSKSFSAFDRSALTQIKQILSDKPRLIKRTQLKRSSYRVLGKAEKELPPNEPESQEQANAHLKDYDSEIFDDDDFYHQLLRELIERRTTTNSDDPIEMSRQWLELQKLRRKIKKKIDTKASKGRKLRYNVHSKLIGYMPPIETGNMPDSSRNELFSSLFGQRKIQSEGQDVDVFR